MISEAYDDNDFGFTFATEDTIVQQSGTVSPDIVEELKQDYAKLRNQYLDDLQKLEKLILPLLRNLLKEPDKEYIIWKDREKPIQEQIKKILMITQKAI